MPIEVTPVDIYIPAPPVKRVANKLHIDFLQADARGEVQGADNKPTGTLRTRLYFEDDRGNRTYAPGDDVASTRDIYAAIANIPEIGAMLQASFAMAAAWRAYKAARKVEADAAQVVVNAKQATIADADAAHTAAILADQAGSTPATRQAITDTTAAVEVARAAYVAAEVVLSATLAAYDDPANPQYAAPAVS